MSKQRIIVTILFNLGNFLPKYFKNSWRKSSCCNLCLFPIKRQTAEGERETAVYLRLGSHTNVSIDHTSRVVVKERIP